MVKFGRHCTSFSENHPLYTVDYAFIRNSTIENVDEDEKKNNNDCVRRRFEDEWRKSLGLATSDFAKAMIRLWKKVFTGIEKSSAETGFAGDEEGSDGVRGALPDSALCQFLSVSTAAQTQELLFLAKQIYNTAMVNSEALRKLVKKFDKQHGANLSVCLLPEVYGANFTVGQSTLQAGTLLIRAHLGVNVETYSSDSRSDSDTTSSNSAENLAENLAHDTSIMRRKSELEWLKDIVELIGHAEVPNLVAHRGFHSTMDRSDRRPLENSLTAYETAWTSGMHLCECDIALTKDEKLVLAHDETFARLALDPTSPSSTRFINDLTYRDLVSLPLTSGSRPPLLIDVLRSAKAIGGPSQLIVEIKPGNVATASALARLFIRHPELMERCAVVMSFDAFAMHSLRRDMRVLLDVADVSTDIAVTEGDTGGYNSAISLPSTMSLGHMGFTVASVAGDSTDHFGIGQHVDKSGNARESKSRTNSFSFSPFNVSCTNISPCLTGLSTSPHSVPPLMSEHVMGEQTMGGRHDSAHHFGIGLGLVERAVSINDRRESFSFSPFNQYKVIPPVPSSSLPSPSILSPSSPLPSKSLSVSQNIDPIAKTTGSDTITTEPIAPLSPMNLPNESKVLPTATSSAVTSQNNNTARRKKVLSVPKLMLLTVAEVPKVECELRTSVSDLSLVDQWLRGGDGGRLDGVYLQFENEMLTMEGASALRSFIADNGLHIGVWGHAGRDPDCLKSFRYLCKEGGVSFVNTDLPKNFKDGV